MHDLRAYFAAHAPAMPDWYAAGVPHPPGKPTEPKEVPYDEKQWNAYHRATAAWERERNLSRMVLWAWEWADAMVAAGKGEADAYESTYQTDDHRSGLVFGGDEGNGNDIRRS
jgi:hypothetical protein